MKKLRGASAILAAAALIMGSFTACDYTGDTTFDAAIAANTSQQATEDAAYTGPGSEDSWNFVSSSDTWVTAFNANGSITNATDGTRTLANTQDIAGSKGSLTLTLQNEKTASVTSSGSVPSFSYMDSTIGLRIKSSAIKISGVKGKTKLTVKWAAFASSRSLEVAVEGGDIDSKEATGTSTTTWDVRNTTCYQQEDYTKVFTCGSGKNIWISGSNNVYIQSIKLENAADAVTTINLYVPNTSTGAYGDAVTYDMGDTSLTASALSTKLKADSSYASLITFINNKIQAEALAAGVTMTVTKDMWDYTFSETQGGTAVTTVTGGKSYYGYYATNSAYTAAYNLANKKSATLTYVANTEVSNTDGTTVLTLSEQTGLNTAKTGGTLTGVTGTTLTESYNDEFYTGSSALKLTGKKATDTAETKFVQVTATKTDDNTTFTGTFYTLSFDVTSTTAAKLNKLTFYGHSGKGSTGSDKVLAKVTIGSETSTHDVRIPKNSNGYPADLCTVDLGDTALAANTATTIKIEFYSNGQKKVSCAFRDIVLTVTE